MHSSVEYTEDDFELTPEELADLDYLDAGEGPAPEPSRDMTPEEIAAQWSGLVDTYGIDMVGPLDIDAVLTARDQRKALLAARDAYWASDEFKASQAAFRAQWEADHPKREAERAAHEAWKKENAPHHVAKYVEDANRLYAQRREARAALPDYLNGGIFEMSELTGEQAEAGRAWVALDTELGDAEEDAFEQAKLWAEKYGLSRPGTQREIDREKENERIGALIAIWDAQRGLSDPEDIWACGRPELEHIMAMARRSKLSPWALLGATLTRAAATVPYYVPFRSFLGRRPINLLVAMTGGTGAGKTAVEAAAGDAFDWPADLGHTLEAGSGEAIPSAFAYVAGKDDKEMGVSKGDVVWRREDHMARFLFDEVGRLNAIQGRQGATVFEYLKSAESGASLGRVLASQEGVQIPANEYRLVATINVQPERAHLITSADEAAGGLPGRMLWASTTYAPFVGMPRDRRRVQAFPLPHLNWTLVDAIDALEEMEDAFEEQQDAAHAGTLDPMESHSNLLRAKVAVCLMVLAGRQQLISEDWALAGLIMEHSRRVRGDVLRAIAAAEMGATGSGDIEREMAVMTAMRRHRTEGLTMGEGRRRLRGEQRKLWDALVARGAAGAQAW